MKKMTSVLMRAAIAPALLAFVTISASAQTKELKVLCSNGIKDAVEHTLADPEKKIGRKINIEYSASTRFQKSIEEGAAFHGRIDMAQRTIAAKVAQYKAAQSA